MPEMENRERLQGRRMDRPVQITVLLAAYNGEAYVAEQLDSILNQTVEHLKIIVSDDGSGDGTRRILEDYQRRYPGQIELCHHEKTGTGQETSVISDTSVRQRPSAVPPAAMNFFWLLAHAQGDYILLSDQDDVWKPDKVEKLLAKLEELEELLGIETPILVHSDMEVVDARLNQISPSFFRYQKANPHRSSLAQVLVENPVTGGAMMMNRALLEMVRQVPRACFMHDWWIALVAAGFGVIGYVPEALYLYRQHGHNTLGAKEIGSIREVKERLSRQQQVEAAYERMFSQAAAFGEMYGSRLNQRQRSVLRAYLALRLQSCPGRLKNILRNHFYKSSLLQTVAQCVTIPKVNHSED